MISSSQIILGYLIAFRRLGMAIIYNRNVFFFHVNDFHTKNN